MGNYPLHYCNNFYLVTFTRVRVRVKSDSEPTTSQHANSNKHGKNGSSTVLTWGKGKGNTLHVNNTLPLVALPLSLPFTLTPCPNTGVKSDCECNTCQHANPSKHDSNCSQHTLGGLSYNCVCVGWIRHYFRHSGGSVYARIVSRMS